MLIKSLNPEYLDQLHDASVNSINTENGKIIIAGFSDINRWHLAFNKVKYFVCSPFLNGNIIDSVNVHLFRDVKMDNLNVSDGLKALFDVYGPKVDNISFSDFKFLEITSSYGAEILCLFDGEIDFWCENESS